MPQREYLARISSSPQCIWSLIYKTDKQVPASPKPDAPQHKKMYPLHEEAHFWKDRLSGQMVEPFCSLIPKATAGSSWAHCGHQRRSVPESTLSHVHPHLVPGSVHNTGDAKVDKTGTALGMPSTSFTTPHPPNLKGPITESLEGGSF